MSARSKVILFFLLATLAFGGAVMMKVMSIADGIHSHTTQAFKTQP